MKSYPLNHIPRTPGVYMFKDKKGTILYIGKAKNLRRRIAQYFSPGSVRKRDMVKIATEIDFIEIGTETDALMFEDNLIKKYLPKYNRLLKKTNYYCFVKYTNEPFPRVFVTRKRNDDGGIYIGPKRKSRELYQILGYLRTVYKFRTMKKGEFDQGEVGLDYYMGLDEGWNIIAKRKSENPALRKEKADSIGIDTSKSYEHYRQAYSERLDEMRSLLEGDNSQLLDHISDRIQYYISQENYEYCKYLKKIYQYAEHQHSTHQEIVFDVSKTGYCLSFITIEKYHVIIGIYIHEGTIVDLFREKKNSEDHTLEQLYASAQGEYNTTRKRTTRQGYTMFYDKDLIGLGKKNRGSIDKHQETFLQSYIKSSQFHEGNLVEDVLHSLQSNLGLQQLPIHIEGLALTLTKGNIISGGLVSYLDGSKYARGSRHFTYDPRTESGEALEHMLHQRFSLDKQLNADGMTLPTTFIIVGSPDNIAVLDALYVHNSQFGALSKEVEFVIIDEREVIIKKGKTVGEKKRAIRWDSGGNHTHHSLGNSLSDRFLFKIKKNSQAQSESK